jgi:hypothetical protein
LLISLFILTRQIDASACDDVNIDADLASAVWRQQLRLAEAVVRLVNGEAVTAVAMSLG